MHETYTTRQRHDCVFSSTLLRISQIVSPSSCPHFYHPSGAYLDNQNIILLAAIITFLFLQHSVPTKVRAFFPVVHKAMLKIIVLGGNQM